RGRKIGINCATATIILFAYRILVGSFDNKTIVSFLNDDLKTKLIGNENSFIMENVKLHIMEVSLLAYQK
ncbi:MAG: hypothetical protein MHPSP_002953, partial [Paramarteilia canceri]